MDTSSSPTVNFSWNLPNVLTISRVVLVPVFVVMLLLPNETVGRWLALLVFVIASITDRYDGLLARRRNMVTNFGKIADSFADKLLTGAAFIMLSYLGSLPWWVTVIILAREWGITAMRFAMVRKQVMAAGAGGKAKMVLQIVGICLLLVPWVSLLGDRAGTGMVLVSQAVVYLAALLTVITGIDYVVKAVKISRAHKASERDGS
ncbi:MAG TPA: CDP-diacylglycerol--glycerol-3-phosphate 3-phosphatidyltransferase [Beutenbergiaceae bacterium]|nr:CDP-diacylglycerol--glycerol-3-phosphate 3-phosphatidyltransferase [Beutenbergiaceae bacterium]